VSAAFATILMIVGNTMVMAVRERTREIGVLKALGFPGPRILRLVLGESIALALIGGVPGLIVAWLGARLLRVSLSAFVPGLAVTPDIFLLGVILMIGLGVLTGLLPALNAMRLKTAVALGRS
jgi:putative ABC transport system permease protein